MPTYALTPPLEEFIAKKIASGDYCNASEVVRDALRIMQHRDAHLSDLDVRLDVSLAEANRGEGRPVDDVLSALASRFENGPEDTHR